MLDFERTPRTFTFWFASTVVMSRRSPGLSFASIITVREYPFE